MKRNILSLVFFLAGISLYAQNWVPLGYIGTSSSLAVDASGNLYGADYINANGYRYVAKWNGSRWREVGLGTSTLNANAAINTITFDADGNLYAAGNFTNQPYQKGKVYVAKWDGTSWTELDGYRMNAIREVVMINCLATDASGNVYAAGYFNSTNTYDISIMKWDGLEWTDIGVDPPFTRTFQGGIYNMVIDKSGNIYVAGALTKAHETYYVAKWDGTSWTEVGTGTNALNANGPIYSLALDSEDNLYAGGFFKNEEDQYYIAKWDGAAWSQLDAGSEALNPNVGVEILTVDTHDNLYAGGTFVDDNGGVYIAKWDGTSWSRMGPGISNSPALGQIRDIIADPNSENLFASGMLFINTDQASGYTVQWNSSITSVVNSDKPAIQIYPNPGNGIIHIPLADETLAVTILDVQGKNIGSKTIAQGSSYLDCSFLTTGMYTLIFTGLEISYAPVKLIKE